MRREYWIDACCGRAIEVGEGQKITIVDVEGGQVVDFFAEVMGNPREFLSAGVTLDCNASLRLEVGGMIYSNLYRPMFQLAADDVGEHDLLHPCCRPEMYDFFYGNGDGHANCLENINGCLGEERPQIHPVNFFMHTTVTGGGRIVVKKPASRAGDRVELLAKMDVRLGIAACSVSESDCNGGVCSPVKIVVED